MPRETVVGNGRLVVAFDSRMNIRDFFYPKVGLENHVSGHELRMGIWADGEFRWLDDGWERETKYMPETLVSRSLASHPGLRIQIETNDAVNSSSDVFLRKVMVGNLAKTPRKIRIFFTHDFHIYGDAVGDTVMHEPSLNAIIHYKRKRYFLVDGVTSKGLGNLPVCHRLQGAAGQGRHLEGCRRRNSQRQFHSPGIGGFGSLLRAGLACKVQRNSLLLDRLRQKPQ